MNELEYSSSWDSSDRVKRREALRYKLFLRRNRLRKERIDAQRKAVKLAEEKRQAFHNSQRVKRQLEAKGF